MHRTLDTRTLLYRTKNKPPPVATRINGLGGDDLWIACHAFAEDATLVTHNTDQYSLTFLSE